MNRPKYEKAYKQLQKAYLDGANDAWSAMKQLVRSILLSKDGDIAWLHNIIEDFSMMSVIRDVERFEDALEERRKEIEGIEGEE